MTTEQNNGHAKNTDGDPRPKSWKISAEATIMKGKVQNPELYQDSGDGHIPVNQKIDSLYTDSI